MRQGPRRTQGWSLFAGLRWELEGADPSGELGVGGRL